MFFNSSLSMKMKRCLFCLHRLCVRISLWQSLVCHVLRVCTVIAIKHNYGVSVLMLYIFSVLMEDASVCLSARPWDALNECPSVHDRSTAIIWDVCWDVRSNKTPYGIRAGLCASRSKSHESSRAGGWLHKFMFEYRLHSV